MNELIEGFLKAAQGSDDTLSLKEMLNEEEIFQWEVLVKAMDSIDVLHVGKDLEKISRTYQLKKWQEMSIIAYVKVLEMMIKRAKDYASGDSTELPIPQPESSKGNYTGSMFG